MNSHSACLNARLGSASFLTPLIGLPSSPATRLKSLNARLGSASFLTEQRRDLHCAPVASQRLNARLGSASFLTEPCAVGSLVLDPGTAS